MRAVIEKVSMARINPPLHWDDKNVAHLWQSHMVTPDEIEEILFGIPGEETTYKIRRDADFYIIYGETGSGRLLKFVGDFREGLFRVFAARDMDSDEKRAYRKGK